MNNRTIHIVFIGVFIIEKHHQKLFHDFEKQKHTHYSYTDTIVDNYWKI